LDARFQLGENMAINGDKTNVKNEKRKVKSEQGAARFPFSLFPSPFYSSFPFSYFIIHNSYFFIFAQFQPVGERHCWTRPQKTTVHRQ
jgi:hypothetical protein